MKKNNLLTTILLENPKGWMDLHIVIKEEDEYQPKVRSELVKRGKWPQVWFWFVLKAENWIRLANHSALHTLHWCKEFYQKIIEMDKIILSCKIDLSALSVSFWKSSFLRRGEGGSHEKWNCSISWGKMILMPFPYCQKCHLHWLTFSWTMYTNRINQKQQCEHCFSSSFQILYHAPVCIVFVDF